jgi:hypothetical protein
MAKIVLNDVSSGFDLSKIRDNFDKISEALNSDVYWRDNPEGEDNSLVTDMDANGRRVYNLPDPLLDGEPVTKKYLSDTVGNASQAAIDAANSAAEAAQSAMDAEGSADTAAAIAADVSEVVENVAPNVYEFDGDNATVDFTIGTFPPSKEFVKVFVDGERIPLSAFSILNNIVTITPAPPVGTDNVIIDVSATVAAIIDNVEDWGLLTDDPEAADDYGSIV